jgi:pyridoxamine 5'-phosphate oxidase-like protein
MNRTERREFVRTHRTAIFGYGRREHGPSMTTVYYLSDGDDILISTMAERGKAKAVARGGRVSLCILDEQWPPTYLLVYCDARVETDFAQTVDVMIGIAGVMAGSPMPPEVRPMIEEGARLEKRVVLRLTPYSTFESPPRHVHSAADVNEKLRHDLGATLPW